jgi:hypothetical protein
MGRKKRGQIGDYKWLVDYEARRANGGTEMSQLLQIRPDLYGLSWKEIRELETDLVDNDGKIMNIGQGFQALKRSWYSFKLNRKYGTPAPELALRILKLQKGLQLPLSDFESELEGYGGMAWALQELNNEESSGSEEKTIKREERQSMLESLGVDTSSEESDWSEWDESDEEDDLNGSELTKKLKDEEFRDRLNAWGLDDEYL